MKHARFNFLSITKKIKKSHLFVKKNLRLDYTIGIHSETGRQVANSRYDEIKTTAHRTNHHLGRDPGVDCENNGGLGGGGEEEEDDDDDSVSDDCPKKESIEATVHIEFTAR